VSLAHALLPILAPGSVVAFVGAGGKTAALFRLARELAASGHSVLVTTTTHLLDPRRDPRTPPGEIVVRPEMASPLDGEPGLPGRGGITVLLSREADETGRVSGVHPSWVPALRSSWDFVLVEADGSRGLPVKAPGPHEPVLPPGADLVVGVVGLDALGRPMDGRTVHHPELFTEVTGCESAAPIEWRHLAALTRHPLGLWKGVSSKRALLLNKSDLVSDLPSGEELRDLVADQVIVGALEGRERFTVPRREEDACP
jgi:probable selenium-dependent hydroxylase accessory protein YqeC